MNAIDKKTTDFTEIYNDFYPVVYGAVYSKVTNVDEARDICQEVFLRYFEKYESVENPRKWLLGSLRLVVLEHYRRKGGNESNVEHLFEDISMSFVNGFRDTRLIIEDALNDMGNFEDEKGRILFELIAINNLTYKEAGAQLGLTMRQARYKYNIITERLIKYLNKKGIKNLEELL